MELWRELKALIMEPASFFAESRAGYRRSLAFSASVFAFTMLVAGRNSLDNILTDTLGPFPGILYFILVGALLGVSATLFVGGMCFVLSRLMGGTGDFESTLRVASYSYVSVFLVLLPFNIRPFNHTSLELVTLDMLAFVMVWLYFLFYGLREVHELSSIRTLLVAGVVLAIVGSLFIYLFGEFGLLIIAVLFLANPFPT